MSKAQAAKDDDASPFVPLKEISDLDNPVSLTKVEQKKSNSDMAYATNHGVLETSAYQQLRPTPVLVSANLARLADRSLTGAGPLRSYAMAHNDFAHEAEHVVLGAARVLDLERAIGGEALPQHTVAASNRDAPEWALSQLRVDIEADAYHAARLEVQGALAMLHAKAERVRRVALEKRRKSVAAEKARYDEMFDLADRCYSAITNVVTGNFEAAFKDFVAKKSRGDVLKSLWEPYSDLEEALSGIAQQAAASIENEIFLEYRAARDHYSATVKSMNISKKEHILAMQASRKNAANTGRSTGLGALPAMAGQAYMQVAIHAGNARAQFDARVLPKIGPVVNFMINEEVRLQLADESTSHNAAQLAVSIRRAKQLREYIDVHEGRWHNVAHAWTRRLMWDDVNTQLDQHAPHGAHGSR